ncbi:MAG TPA: GntR family transcriptional regulator [Longimicrobiales bacterium]
MSTNAPSDNAVDRAGHAYRRLRDLILHGRLGPGFRLTEIEVARRLGMSRTPVRSALQRLQQEGYVLTIAGGRQSRTVVAPLTRDDARELFGIVGELEGLAGAMAARLPDRVRLPLVREMERLTAELLAISRAPAPDPNRRFENDTEFHALYVNAAAGPRLRALHAAVRPQAERYVRLYISLLVDAMGTSHDEHAAITAAIAAADPDAAQQSVRMNWINAAERLCAVMSEQGERGIW